jgi:ketosteroid isomerase-like protein
MSEENVVRRAAEFWVTRDFSPMTELFDSEVVIDLSRNVFNPDIYRGYDGVRRYVEVVDEMWDDFTVELQEVVGEGDRVVTGTVISGVGRGSGVKAEMTLFQVWSLRDGKVVRITGGYRDRAQAREAAGLGE